MRLPSNALGSESGGSLVVYFIAGTEPSLAIENPRQRLAYDHPPRYGKFRPAFSRATLMQAAALPMLFVSGTASIVGHRTVHVGNVRAQTRETVKNIRSLVTEANRAAGAELFAPEELKYKVYLRRPDDLEVVASELSHLLAPATPVVCLHADACRARS
jgi:chorismate lyase / 3-hydroxybenzoate synthase